MTCPDSNPNSGFHDLLVRLSPHTRDHNLQRKYLYYSVCLLFRLSLYNLVFLFQKEVWVQVVVGMFSLISFLQLYFFFDGNTQWWSKRFQMTMAFLVVLSTLGFVFKKLPSSLTPLLLYTSLLGGFFQSFNARWC